MATARVILGKSPRVKINISTKYPARVRRMIARDIIAYIIQRTRQGLGKDAKPWSGAAARYSKSYRNSQEFNIGGKSAGLVNLTLSSEMLDSMEIKSDSAGSVTVGVGAGQEGKAEGNIKGTYGQNSPIRGKRRNFLDLSQRELSAILSAYPVSRSRENIEESEDGEALEDRASEIVDGLFSDESI